MTFGLMEVGDLDRDCVSSGIIGRQLTGYRVRLRSWVQALFVAASQKRMVNPKGSFPKMWGEDRKHVVLKGVSFISSLDSKTPFPKN